MPISSYSDLIADIKDAMPRSETGTDGLVKTFIALVEEELNTRRFRQMMTSDTLTTVAGTATVDLPADFLDLRALEMSDSPRRLERLSLDRALASYASSVSGRPVAYAFANSGVIRLFPTPDTAYSISLYYYQTVPALSDAATSNWVLARYSGAYKYGGLYHYALHTRDEKAAEIYGSLYAAILDAMARDAQKYKTTGNDRIVPRVVV